MSLPLSIRERVQGCLLGGALGDAIGNVFEGTRVTTDLLLPNRLSLTDDTQLTIATCESIIQSRGVEPEIVAKRFLQWYRSRRLTGLGSSTLKALAELDAGGHWAMVGATGERAAGNGAAMRIAPLAFLLDPANPQQRTTIRDVCRITHRNDEAYSGALAMVCSLRHVVVGNPIQSLSFQKLATSLFDSRVRDRLLEVHETELSVPSYSAKYGTSGYVADSVPLALLAALKSTDFLTTITALVQCGGDTDTIASLYGQIYGAMHGPSLLPHDLLERIEEIELVYEVAEQFSALLTEIG